MSGSRARSLFLVDDGAAMIVASTIAPLGNLHAPRVQMRMHRFENSPAKIVLFNQIQRRLVRRRLAAKIDANQITHRDRIIKRFLRRRVRKIEPVLKEIHPQHPLQTNRAPARLARRRRRIIMRAQSARPTAPRAAPYPSPEGKSRGALSWRNNQIQPPKMSSASRSASLNPKKH